MKKSKMVPAVPRAGDGNTKAISRASPAKHWLLTIPSESISKEELEKRLQNICKKYCYQLEKGENTNYMHYQVYIELLVKKRPSELKKMLPKESHNLMCNNIEASKKYVHKEETRIAGPYEWTRPKYPDIELPDKLYKWQVDLKNILLEKPDNRTVWWFWEEDGNSGKTIFCKYMVCHHDAIYIKGKKADMLYAAAECESNIVLIDLSRVVEDRVPYEAIEDLKNGIFFSGKYESKMIVRNSPHVVVFANYEPDRIKLSLDRWRVRDIDSLQK